MEEFLHQLIGIGILLFSRFYTSQVVQDFHKQYRSFREGYPTAHFAEKENFHILSWGWYHSWVVVSNICGKWSKLTHIFQMGWKHQLDLKKRMAFQQPFFEWFPGVMLHHNHKGIMMFIYVCITSSWKVREFQPQNALDSPGTWWTIVFLHFHPHKWSYFNLRTTVFFSGPTLYPLRISGSHRDSSWLAKCWCGTIDRFESWFWGKNVQSPNLMIYLYLQNWFSSVQGVKLVGKYTVPYISLGFVFLGCCFLTD